MKTLLYNTCALLLVLLLAAAPHIHAQDYTYSVQTGQTYEDLTDNAALDIDGVNTFAYNLEYSLVSVYFFEDLYDFADNPINIGLPLGNVTFQDAIGETTTIFGLNDFTTKNIFNDSSEISVRILDGWMKVQYKNITLEGGSPEEQVNFQIWLQFDNGRVELHYGPNTVSSITPEPRVGLLQQTTDFANKKVLLLSGDPSSATATASGASTLNGVPANGTVYTMVRTGPNTGIIPKTSLPKVQVYPNPTQGRLHLDLNDEATTVAVYNMYGQRVLHMPAAKAQNLDVSDLPNGTYLVKAAHHDGTVSQARFVKH